MIEDDESFQANSVFINLSEVSGALEVLFEVAPSLLQVAMSLLTSAKCPL